MTRSRHWHAGRSTVTVRVSCSGAEHRVTWKSGGLVVHDHDVPGELALAALGAEPPPCVEMLRRWRRMFTRTRVGIEALSVLPAELWTLARLGVVVGARRRWSALSAADREQMMFFLTARVREAVDSSFASMRLSRPALRVQTTCTVIDETEQPWVEVSRRGETLRVVVHLGLAWLIRVWSWDLAAVGDLLVLDTQTTPTPQGAAVEGVWWEATGLHGVASRPVSTWVEFSPLPTEK